MMALFYVVVIMELYSIVQINKKCEKDNVFVWTFIAIASQCEL